MVIPSSPKRVVAAAGRRIDPQPAEVRRFPFERVPEVERALSQLFEDIGVSILVSSAACGADLVALKVAGAKDIPARIILPFSAPRFKETSVLDRPYSDYWGDLFEQAIAAASAAGKLVELAGGEDDEAAYSAVNKAIIEDALSLASSEPGVVNEPPIAVVIWEGQARDGSDLTDQFRVLAEAAGFDMRTILTV